jgi:hypothetical protein
MYADAQAPTTLPAGVLDIQNARLQRLQCHLAHLIESRAFDCDRRLCGYTIWLDYLEIPSFTVLLFAVLDIKGYHFA